jgi:hypothetical protein
LCRIYKKPNQQLSPLYDPSPSPPSMDAGSLGHHDHPHLEDHSSSSFGQTLPRDPSISDYLVDYSAVSELFDSMPPPPQPEQSSGVSRFFLGSSTGEDEASTGQKRSAMDGNNNRGDMSLHASKRWLSSSDTSTTTTNTFSSMFGPDQQS